MATEYRLTCCEIPLTLSVVKRVGVRMTAARLTCSRCGQGYLLMPEVPQHLQDMAKTRAKEALDEVAKVPGVSSSRDDGRTVAGGDRPSSSTKRRRGRGRK